MDDKQIVSPQDPRTNSSKKSSIIGTVVLLGAIIGAGSWVYRDFQEDEERAFEDCVNEITGGRNFLGPFDLYIRRAQDACGLLSEEDAQDIVFVTMMNVCAHDPDEKENIEQVYRRSVVNGAISFCRKRGKRLSVSFNEYQHSDDDEVSEAALSPEELDAARQAENGLTENERHLIKWRVYDELTYSEIAEKMQVKDWRTAKARVQSALQRVRDLYSDAISDL